MDKQTLGGVVGEDGITQDWLQGRCGPCRGVPGTGSRLDSDGVHRSVNLETL